MLVPNSKLLGLGKGVERCSQPAGDGLVSSHLGPVWVESCLHPVLRCSVRPFTVNVCSGVPTFRPLPPQRLSTVRAMDVNMGVWMTMAGTDVCATLATGWKKTNSAAVVCQCARYLMLACGRGWVCLHA